MGSRTRTLLAATTGMLELDREGVSLNIIQRQLGHANLGTTSMYL
jgi:integrase